MVEQPNRRGYPRVKAPMYWRPTSVLTPKHDLVNVGLGGARIYSDEALKIGERLEIELFLPEPPSISCLVEVAWITDLGKEAPARFDVGLKFLEVPPDALRRLAHVLESNLEP